ncbi:MAG: hypothetical protein K9W43_09740 [Candidatus Thorarchaeota archaeon]|nr:hypothetical protein [Candidatus Thorarchaeota archaeon]
MVHALEDPRIRILLELRKELDEEYERLSARLEKIRAYRQALDNTIGVGSFATADTALGKVDTTQPTATVQRTPETAAPETPKTIEVFNKSRTTLLATIQNENGTLVITPAEDALYDIKRGAFARFFVERILGKFQQEDRHRVENGEITWDQVFDFNVSDEEGFLKEIIIKNYGTKARLEEIQRALRWALEKVYTKR